MNIDIIIHDYYYLVLDIYFENAKSEPKKIK